MRTSTFFLCANLRTLGLDGTRQHTAAEIKAAFVEKAKSTHPDAGGDAARFRQLKDAYDALRGNNSNNKEREAGEYDEGVSTRTDFAGGGANAAANAQQPPSRADRSHIYTERYNDGDGWQSSEKGTWDYGSGTRYANASTRSFYRPYTSNYYDPSATGFTRAEVARAELAMRLHVLKRFVWNFVIYGSALYLLYVYVLHRDRPLSTDYEIGPDAEEKARRERELRQLQPQLQSEWSDTKKARYLAEWNNQMRERERIVKTGHSGPHVEATAYQPWNGFSDSTTLPMQGEPVASISFPTTDRYCDMADEDVEVE